jgi:hypothetical protein
MQYEIPPNEVQFDPFDCAISSRDWLGASLHKAEKSI